MLRADRLQVVLALQTPRQREESAQESGSDIRHYCRFRPCSLTLPNQIAAAAASRTAAEMTSEACNPVMNAPAWPARDPNRATPSTLPVWRVALSTPAAMPERERSALP